MALPGTLHDEPWDLMRAFNILLLFLFTLPLSGCELIGDIFEAGVWVGVLGVLLVLGIVWFLMNRLRR